MLTPTACRWLAGGDGAGINSCWHFLSFSFKYPLGSQASRPRFLVLKLQGSLFTEAGQFGAF